MVVRVRIWIARPVIQVRRVNHIGSHAAVGQGAAKQPYRPGAESGLQLGDQLLAEDVGAQHREARHEHPCFTTSFTAGAGLRGRQGACHVRQAAGFQQWINFTTNV